MPSTSKFQNLIRPQDLAENPECLKDISRGDSIAFEWLYKTYSKRVFDYAFLLTGVDETSKDAVQEVFLKVWIKRRELEGIQNFNAWLHSITRNHIVDQVRKKATEIQHLDSYLYYELCNALPEFQNDEGYCALVAEAVEQLSAQKKLIYCLIRENRWKRVRVARALALTPYTVKAHMQQALKTIKVHVRENIELM